MAIDQKAIETLTKVEPYLTMRPKPRRELSVDASDTGLNAILDEISCTILPRNLVFESTHQHCHLVVSNRRVYSADTAGLSDAKGSILRAQPQLLAQALLDLSTAGGAVQVSAHCTDLDIRAGDANLSADELKRFCHAQGWLHNISEVKTAPCSFVDELESCSVATAILPQDGSATINHEEGALLLRDIEYLRAVLDRLAPAREEGEGGSTSAPQWLVFHKADSHSDNILTVYATVEESCVHVVPQATLSRLAQAWKNECSARKIS